MKHGLRSFAWMSADRCWKMSDCCSWILATSSLGLSLPAWNGWLSGLLGARLGEFAEGTCKVLYKCFLINSFTNAEGLGFK